MQNLGFVYELNMFSTLKNCLVSFSKHKILFWHGSLMTQWAKAILLIERISFFILSYAFNQNVSPFALRKRD